MNSLQNNMTPAYVADEKIQCHHCQSVMNLSFLFSHRAYYRCPSCDLIFAGKHEDIKTDLAYYQELYFDNEAEDQMSGRRTNIYRHVLDLVENYKKSGTLFDVGCGCGFFLKEARGRGWHVGGVDPSRKSIEYAKSLIGDVAVCGTVQDVTAGLQYDVITLINVLDHMVDACRQLHSVLDLLALDGIIYLRFPNGSFHSFMLHLSRMLSAERLVSSYLIFHEYALTPKAIKRCLGDMGFTDIRVLNAPLTGGNFFIGGRAFPGFVRKILSALVWSMAKYLEKLSRGKWIWGPSVEVIARKGSGGLRA